MKKLFWFIATSILLLGGTISTPLPLKADGNPPPMCPTGKMGCKPALVAPM